MTEHIAPNTPTGQRDDKAFSTLVAQLAFHGHQLHRTHPADGPVSYYVTRWGMVRSLPDLDTVKAFVRQVGGAHA